MEIQDLLAKYFSGNANEEEKRKVEVWREQNESNAREFFATKEIWEASQSNAFDKKSALADVFSRIDLSKQRSVDTSQASTGRFRLNKTAAVLVLLVIIGAVLYMIFGQQQQSQQNIQSEERREYILNDGSKVFMESGSELSFLSDFESGNERKVKLTGRAYFNVSKWNNKPFVIETPNGDIWVRGTSFLVETSSNITTVTVESGIVELTRNNQSGLMKLEPGYIGIIDKKRKGITKRRNSDNNYLAWKNGLISFERAKLLEVANVLQDVYSITLDFKNADLVNCKLTAKFNDRTPDEILDIVARTFSLSIAKKNRHYTIDGDGC